MEPIERIASFLAGTCSEQEKQQLEAWRRKAPANEKEFSKYKKVWEAAGPAENFCPNAEKAWQKIHARLFREPTLSEPTRRLSVPLYRRPFAIAAMVALFILGSGTFLFLRQNADGSSHTSIETNSREKQQVLLTDGTQVWLNQNSKIFYPENFSGGFREVSLEGEAFFEVAHMPEKPFVIKAGNAKVQVLGTAFNLEVREQVKVQVASGRVQFSANNQSSATSLILEAGDAARLKEGAIQKEKQDPNFIAWKTGEFTFENAWLEDVFLALEKYYHVKISASSEIKNCRLFVRFQQQPIEEVLQVVALTLQLKYDFKPGGKEARFYAPDPTHACSSANP